MKLLFSDERKYSETEVKHFLMSCLVVSSAFCVETYFFGSKIKNSSLWTRPLKAMEEWNSDEKPNQVVPMSWNVAIHAKKELSYSEIKHTKNKQKNKH